MTEHAPDHDDWPEEYRNPRDRPHPETLWTPAELFEGDGYITQYIFEGKN